MKHSFAWTAAAVLLACGMTADGARNSVRGPALTGAPGPADTAPAGPGGPAPARAFPAAQ